MRQPAIILIVIGIIVLFIGIGGASVLSLSSTPNYLPSVETVSPSGTSSDPTVLTSSTFPVSVAILEENIYGNTANQSDVVIGTVIVTGVSVSVDGINESIPLTASHPSEWGAAQEYFNTTITLPTQVFSGPIYYIVSYYDDMDTGATSTATATWGGYLALNSGAITSLTITGTWTINGILVTSQTQIINLTTTQINVYYINTEGGQYIASEFLDVVSPSTGPLFEVPLTKLSNGTWFATFTLQPGTYDVFGDINTTEGGIQSMELFGSFGPPAPVPAPSYFSFIGAYRLEIIVVGVILIIIGLLLMRV